MNSLLQHQSPGFPDLNGNVVFSGDLVGRVEPKLEPLDEDLDCPPGLQRQLDKQVSQVSSNPNPNPRFDLNANAVTSIGTTSGGEREVLGGGSVLSEFNRISQIFNSAFTSGGEDGEDEEVLVLEESNALAIVAVPEGSSMQVEQQAIVPKRIKYPPRSNELVRVTNLTEEDEVYYREIVRRARMIFDSLSVSAVLDDDRNLAAGTFFRRVRGDTKAASLMRDCGLWLNRDKRIVGAIPGIEIGDVFFFRMELCVLGLHGQVQAGIDYLPSNRSSNGEPVATSVIVSGGYEDDEDSGYVIHYTGHGGQDKNGKQCGHQKLEGGNLALERSMHYEVEVRVIRGFRYGGTNSGKIYVYDGLYKVAETWFDVGKSGFGVYKFKLVRIENQPEMGSAILKMAQTLKTKPLDVRPRGYFCLDLSAKKENFPVLLFNDIDNDQDPLHHQYLVSTVIPKYVFQVGTSNGCECISGCSFDCLCVLKNGGEFPYDNKGTLIKGKPLVFECGPQCRCPPTCRNRVTQKGVRSRFEVFRSRETGWGVRSLDLIQAGAFICEYAGVVLTRDQAQVVSMVGDTLVYPSRFAERWAEWGELSQIYSDYVRPSYPAIPPLDFAMDVSSMRNVACYISHSNSPNVFAQFVLFDHNNVMFPRTMLFAMENIPPLRELSLDYGVAEEWTAKLAICN